MSLSEWVRSLEGALRRPLTDAEAKAAFQYHRAGLSPDDLLKDLSAPAQEPGIYRYEPLDTKRVRRI